MIKIPEDKMKHFSVSYMIMLTLVLFIHYDYAFWITLGIGLCKELYDEHDYGGFSLGDIVADGLGIVAATFVYVVSAT